MARRKDHTREELFTLALNATRDIVVAEGFRNLSARKVAVAIGYSPGTLYNLFSNLDDLMLHLNGSTLDRLYDDVAQVMFTGDAENDLTQLLEAYLRFVEANPRLWNAVVDFSLAGDDAPPHWYAHKVDNLLHLVEQALLPAYGSDQATEAKAAARVLWASLHGICSLSDSGKLDILNMESERAMARILVSNFVAGIIARREGADR